MKSIKKTVMAFILPLTLALATPVFAEKNPIEIKANINLKAGSSYWYEDGTGQGGKFLNCGEGNVKIKKKGSKFEGTLSGEECWMAEPIDENTNHIDHERQYSIKIKHTPNPKNKIKFYTNTGIDFKQWGRNYNERSNYERWQAMNFLELRTGIGVENNNSYIEAELIHPFAINADIGSNPKYDMGFKIETGIKKNRWNLGAEYEETKFNRSRDDKTPDITRATFLGTLEYSF